MTFADRKLYHQIHPIKLTIDIITSILTLYLFWFHYFWIAFILHFLFPILCSFFVIKYLDLETQKQSAFGKYIKKYMNNRIVTIRLAGDIITVISAWYHLWLFIIAGLVIILAAWFNGKLNKYS